MSGKKGQIETLMHLIRDVFDRHGINISMIKARLHAMDLYTRGYRVQIEGEWIQQMRPYEDEIECSVCNERFNILDNCTEKFDFCPNCGAKMKGGESDGTTQT